MKRLMKLAVIVVLIVVAIAALLVFISDNYFLCYATETFIARNASCDSSGTFRLDVVNIYTKDFTESDWTVVEATNSTANIPLEKKGVASRSLVEMASNPGQGLPGTNYSIRITSKNFGDGYCGGTLIFPNVRCP